MYLSLTNLAKSIFSSSFKETGPSKTLPPDPSAHAYIKGAITTRGPCPGLNALANQGYLPRDGKNLTLPMVQHALMTTLHMSPIASASLCRAAKPLLRKDGTFDLTDTRRHNIIEHDASFTRLNFHQGDNYTFQAPMFEAMLVDAGGGPVTHRTLAKTFVRRHRESRDAGSPGLGLGLWFVSVLQAVGVMNTAQLYDEQGKGVLSREVLEAVFVEERFPKEILENKRPRTTFTLLGNAIHMMWFVVFGT